jgi:tetratricopeptide (TPR) repeat protein
MYDEGVKCSDCHDPHTLKLKFDDNKLCIQCHAPTVYDTETHHFHAENTEASLCINCHMTGKNYMGNDFRRDHSFRIPRPDQSVAYGTPNACIGCHGDKSDQWAANSIKKWYGNKRQEHFADALLTSSKTEISVSERQILEAFINSLDYPNVARATVIENLNFTNETQFNTLLIALNDASALVRYNALLKFRALPPEIRKSMALKHMNDSTKMVRVGVAQLILGIDENNFSALDKTVLNQSLEDYETMLFANADFSLGSLQLGDYYLQKNDINKAIKHYKMALQKDSLLILVYSNLATAYSMVQEYSNAHQIMDKWLLLEPELRRPHYLKGFTKFRSGR